MAHTRVTDSTPKLPARKGRRPVAVDLFAGAGGFALGLEQAGFDVVAAVEYDPIHAAAHAFNFPLTEVVCADASTIKGTELRDAVRRGLHRHGRYWTTGCVDVVFGGPPCQGFSNGGKRNKDDDRNLLVFEFLRLVKELQPRLWVLENVPPMRTADDPERDGKLIERLIEGFQEADYEVRQPEILNASRYGVPQDRRRLILIGSRTGSLPSYPEPRVQPLPKRASKPIRAFEHGGAAPDENLPVGPSVWDAIRDLPNLDTYAELWTTDDVGLKKATVRTLEAVASSYVRRLRGLDRDPTDFSYSRDWNPSALTASRRTGHALRTIARFEETAEGKTEAKSRFYRLDRDGLCPTLRAGTGYERGSFMAPRPIHPLAPRVISVREAARLHSFPDWFRFHISKWHGFRQIGNSLPPLLGRAIGEELVRTLGVRPTKPIRTVQLGDPALIKMATRDAAMHFGADIDAVPSHKLRHRKVGKRGRIGIGTRLDSIRDPLIKAV